MGDQRLLASANIVHMHENLGHSVQLRSKAGSAGTRGEFESSYLYSVRCAHTYMVLLNPRTPVLSHPGRSISLNRTLAMTCSPQYRGSHSPPSSVSSQLESVLEVEVELAEEERYAANDIGEMSVGVSVEAETCPA